jgi:PAS domain S-box-containing protein
MNSPGISSLIAATLGFRAQRRQGEFEEQKLSTDEQPALKEQMEELALVNKQLFEENARQDSLRLLQQSEQQYRFVFEESPQPQWIFDLRTHRLLAVNRATLGLFGFTPEQFSGLTATRLLFPEAVPFFHRDAAIPCPKGQSRGHWPLCKKDGTRIQVEIRAVDLNYDGCPARLVVAIPVQRPELEQPQARKTETISEAADKVAPSTNRAIPDLESQPKLLVATFPDSPAISKPHEITSTPSSAPTRQPVSLGGGDAAETALKIAAPASNLNRTSSPAEKHVLRAHVSPIPQKQSPAPTKQPPVAETKSPAPQKQSPAPAPKQAPARHSPPSQETILLVEPDGKARGLARFVLSRQGYRVIETDCSSTVLALWESESTNVDLLLTDVALPEGISGNALAEQLRQTKPELKVVYTSGTEDEVPMLDEEIIPKPYTPDKLLQAIRNCLVQPERVLSECAM